VDAIADAKLHTKSHYTEMGGDSCRTLGDS
jgi:hypothetical protein